MRNLLLTLALVSPFTLAVASTESRVHYVVVAPGEQPRYEATVISHVTPKTISKTFLIESVNGERYRLDFKANYAAPAAHWQITDLTSGDKLALDLQFDSPASSPHEFVAEARAMRAEGRAHKFRGTVNSGGRRVPISSDEFRDGAFEAKRSLIRNSINTEFRQRLEDLIPLLSFPQFSLACTYFGQLIDANCVPNSGLMIAQAAPSCAFDKRLGVPCSPSQAATAKEAFATRSAKY